MNRDYAATLALFQPGDVLYMREPWGYFQEMPQFPVHYRDDYAERDLEDSGVVRWHSSTTMPRARARTFLRVTAVRVERVQDISEADAEEEGCIAAYIPTNGHQEPVRESFRKLWIARHGAGSWDANPWVFVYEFELAERPKE